MAKHKSKKSPYASQVQAETALRYGPQKSALAELLNQAAQTRDASVGGNIAAAGGISASALAGVPLAERDYKLGLAEQAQSQDQVRGDMSKLGSVTDLLKAATAREAQGANSRLTMLHQGTVGELLDRASRAHETAAYQSSKANDQYAGEVDKIGRQVQDLAAQAGTFAQGREGQLLQEALKNALTTRGQDITARGQDVSAATQAAGQALTAAGQTETVRHHRAIEKGKGRTGPKLSPDQQSKRVNAINQARDIIRTSLKEGIPLSKIKDSFVNGTPNIQAHTVGGKIVTPPQKGIPALPADLVQAGAELATQGKIGAGTRKRLIANQGLDPAHKFPVMSPEETRATRRRKSAAKKTASRIPGVSGVL